MVGEELERDDGQDRADEIGDFGDGDDVVGNAFQLLRAIAGVMAMRSEGKSMTSCSSSITKIFVLAMIARSGTGSFAKRRPGCQSTS
jgi:hypothetical protein